MLDSDRELIPTDERGWPEISGIHDARLNKLSVEFGSSLWFEMAGQHGERRTVVLDTLYLLKIDGPWDAVVIDSVSVWDLAGELDSQSADVDRAWRAILAERTQAGGEADELERLRRRHGRLVLFSLSSSYGGDLLVLCRDVLIDGRRVVAARGGLVVTP